MWLSYSGEFSREINQCEFWYAEAVLHNFIMQSECVDHSSSSSISFFLIVRLRPLLIVHRSEFYIHTLALSKSIQQCLG